jgi:hypothetical protein
MYKLRPLEDQKPKDEKPEDNKPQGDGKTTPEGEEDKKKNEEKSNLNNNGKFEIDPRIFSIAHNAYANTVNEKMAARQIDALRKGVTLYDPKNNTKYLQGDFDALMSGQQAAGQLMHMASQPMTSDGALQTAAYLDSTNKALDYIRQGRAADNQALRKSKEELWKLRYDDDAFNYDVAMKNRQILGDLTENIANVENARDAKNYTNNDVLFQELMMPLKQKANKREALNEQFARSDIHNAVYSNPNDYEADLNEDELKAWNLVQSGEKTYSQLDDVQKGLGAAFMKAQRKVAQAEQNQVRSYYGIPQSKFSGVRGMVTEDDSRGITDWKKKGGILQAKDGAAKIAVAKIRERSKDADRFYKTTKDKQDRIDRAIARVDKKMYRRRDPEKRRK